MWSALFRNSIQAMPLRVAGKQHSKSYSGVNYELKATCKFTEKFRTGTAVNTEPLNLLELFQAMEAAESCQPGQRLLDV